ncbi:Uncharacterised protein [Legionella lansingensis]|uniref:Uncharacterized protein n=1 Tax=Legionella lansingensis TaxID=45067 RepID=A0A0W0VME9_9GAMM|nr:hypothetical protein Llan_1712 [Legionella lansingensis]SNV44723.1 Uncharacterised protein [Legionella lansingensis]
MIKNLKLKFVLAMFRFYIFLGVALMTGVSFAKPCTITHRSCLKLKNQHSQLVRINCNGLNELFSAGHSEGSTQLDLGYGDGLGAPEPRSINCKLDYSGERPKQNFSFYNPYWGSVIEFNLISEKKLEVHITDGWSSKATHYTFAW